MTTGDLKNNLRKLHAELKLINYTNNDDLDIVGLSIGRPSAFLPIFHFVLTEFSGDLSQYFYSKDYELIGKNDKNFVSVIYRILRDEFETKPPLTKEQFFTLGFAERKLQFVTSVIKLCRKKSDFLNPRKKKPVLSSNRAKTSKTNLDLLGETSNATRKRRTNDDATDSITMARMAPLANHCTTPREVARNQDKSLPQSLSNDRDLIVPGNYSGNHDKNPIPRKSPQAPFVARIEKNVGIGVSQSSTKPETTDFYRTHGFSKDSIFDAIEGNDNTIENVCPNSDNGLIMYKTTLVDNVMCPSGNSQRKVMPSPVYTKMTDTDSHAEKQITKHTAIPYVNHCELPEGRFKHVFVRGPDVDVRSPLRVETSDVSFSDKRSREVDHILEYVKMQDRRIKALEKDAEERDRLVKELVETDAKLNRRVMVLETAVALMQEQLEHENCSKNVKARS